MQHYKYIILFAILFPPSINALWETVTYTNIDTDVQTKVARIENEDGYSLEIYRDASDAVRSRLNMNNINRLKEKNCPTYQVDNRAVQNRSINDAPCLSHRQWAEFVLGYVTDNRITSSGLHDLINGNQITYRFILENSGYSATSFSLGGSKQALVDALGNDLQVVTENTN